MNVEFSEKMFDLDDLSDLPEAVKNKISQRTDEFEDNIVRLFNFAKRELSIDEVCVAYYRAYNVEKTRTQIMNKLYQIAQLPNAKIEKGSKKGLYKLKEVKGCDDNGSN